MSRKRKRAEPGSSSAIRSCKRRKPWTGSRDHGCQLQGTEIRHPSLSPYYSRLLSLRAYLLAKLPSSSKARRRRLATVGRRNNAPNEEPSSTEEAATEAQLAHLLDSTVIGLCDRSAGDVNRRREDFLYFSQHQSTDASRSGIETDLYPQSDVSGSLGLKLRE